MTTGERAMILAGDVGGTNTRLAVCTPGGGAGGGGLKILADARFPSRAHAGFGDVIRAFLAGAGAGHALRVACFGIAGPVKDGRCEATNLPWIVDARELSAAFGIADVFLLNDLEAMAYGVGALEPEDFLTLNAGAPRARGNLAVIAAGTGLGEAGLYWSGALHEPFATEGGHCTFAPRDDLEMELLRFLRRRWPHVSVERVCSGPGLVNIYEFLRDTGRGEAPPGLAAEIAAGDPAAAIARAAGRGVPLAEAALDRFVSIYGAEAGNLALKTMARGGVYVGGGIAPKILERLRRPAFLEAFTGKGRMRPLLEAMPLRVILDDAAGLRGAARCGALRVKLPGAA